MNSLIIRVQTSVAGKQRKKRFFYDSLSSLQQLSLKKSDKKILLFAFNWFYISDLTFEGPYHIVFLTIQGISSKRSTFQSFIHWKYRSIKFFFLKKRKNGYGGLLYLLVFFLLLSKSLELFELIHFGMAKNHDDAFEVFSLQHWE